MKYTYVINTGDASMEGSKSNIENKNRQAYFGQSFSPQTHFRLDEDGKKKNSPFFFDTSIITGAKSSLLSFNSQTMLEVSNFSIDDRVVNNKVYEVSDDESGNYIVDLENSQGRILFDPAMTLENTDFILYDKREVSNHFSQIKTATYQESFDDDRLSLYNKVNNANPISPDDWERDFHLFFNGQKIKDFSTSIEISDLDLSTGYLFSIKKDSNTHELTGVADIYGDKFIEKQTNFYLNGMQQNPPDFLETNTGVYMIETGVNASLTLINAESEFHTI